MCLFFLFGSCFVFLKERSTFSKRKRKGKTKKKIQSIFKYLHVLRRGGTKRLNNANRFGGIYQKEFEWLKRILAVLIPLRNRSNPYDHFGYNCNPFDHFRYCCNPFDHFRKCSHPFHHFLKQL